MWKLLDPRSTAATNRSSISATVLNTLKPPDVVIGAHLTSELPTITPEDITVRVFLINDPRLCRVAELQLHHISDEPLQRFVKYRRTNLNSVVQVTCHPVRRTNEHLGVTTVLKNKHPWMLQKTVHNAYHTNPVAHTWHARDQ